MQKRARSLIRDKKIKNYLRERRICAARPRKNKDQTEEELWFLALRHNGPRALLARLLTTIRFRRNNCGCMKCCFCLSKKRKYALSDAKIERLRELLGEGPEPGPTAEKKENLFQDQVASVVKLLKGR